jgi:hypothetical protein
MSELTKWTVTEFGDPDDGPYAVSLKDPTGREVMCQCWDEPTVKHLRELADKLNSLESRLALAEEVVEKAKECVADHTPPTLPGGCYDLDHCGCEIAQLHRALAAYEKGAK